MTSISELEKNTPYTMNTPAVPEVQRRVQASIDSGVWVRSSEAGRCEYIIFASDLPFDQTVEYLNDKNVLFKNLTGSYTTDDGTVVQADAFITNIDDLPVVSVLLQGQESVLALSQVNVYDERQVVLMHLATNEPTDLGVLKPISEEEAVKLDNWTYDPYQNQYFTTSDER